MGAANPKLSAQSARPPIVPHAQTIAQVQNNPAAATQQINQLPIKDSQDPPEQPLALEQQPTKPAKVEINEVFKKRQDETGYEDMFQKVDVSKKPQGQGVPLKQPSSVPEDTIIKAFDFAKAGPAQEQGGFLDKMNKTARKKLEVLIQKKLEKGTEKMRAKTPDTVMKMAYEDVLEGPLLKDYLKAQQYFKDEMDLEGDDYIADLKHASELANPLQWDSNTIVQNVFRVLQDLTPYIYDFKGLGEVGNFTEVQDPAVHNFKPDEKPISEVPLGLQGNKLVGNSQGTLSGQGGREFYDTGKLYGQNLNNNLSDPPLVIPPKQGKALMTLRVDLKRTMTTAILKVPSGKYFDKQAFMSQMQMWSSIPYQKRIVRPLCYASLNQDIPLVFVEDVPFSVSLEDVILDRSFYRGCQYRFEIGHKILSCIIQVIEAVDHAHQNGVMHLNLHAGNILVPKCAHRDQHIGFFLTDFGDPLLLQEDTPWSNMHEKIFQRLLKFYPPNILSMIKQSVAEQNVFNRRKLHRTLIQAKNILVDSYCIGILLLFMITGGYDWPMTRDINGLFDVKILEAEQRIDVVSLRAIRATIKQCLILEAGTVERIGDLLPPLRAAKENCEKLLKSNGIGFYTYDKLYKSFLEYLPGQRKESLMNPDIDILMMKDVALYQAEMFQHRQKALYLTALDQNLLPQLTAEEVREKFRAEKHHKAPQITDEDTDSNILNNQAVLAYMKQDYHRCVELFIANQDQFMANPLSCFNFLILCWEAGVYADDFILNELTKVTVNPYTGRQFSSLLYGLIYEGAGNWNAAKTNLGLAYQSVSDGAASQVKRKLDNAKVMDELYQEHFLFGHLEMSDISDICVSFDGKYAASFQKTSRIIVWNLENQKIMKEIEDKNATCMDSNAKLDRLVVGLRSGLIVIFNLQYDNEQIVNVDEIELGFHANSVLQIKLTKDGLHGLSGGLDQYIALWNCQKKLLLTKIDIPGQYLKCCCINMNGENFMYATSGSYNVQFYHHSTGKKAIMPSISLEKHKAQVTAVDITYDGLLGVSAGQDRIVYLWDLMRAEVIRQIEVSSFVLRVTLTPMGKFLSMTQLDGSLSLYETVTGVTWRTEKIDGKHSGVAVMASNFGMELFREGMEHKLMGFINRHRDRLQKEFYDARGIGDSTVHQSPQTQQTSPNRMSTGQGSPSKTRTQGPMPVVVEVDPEDESDYRRTTMRSSQRQQQQEAPQLQQVVEQSNEDVNDVDLVDELMLQDLFFENAVFKFLYFQHDDFTRRISYRDIQQELASINLDRAKDPYSKNNYLLKNSLEQLEPTNNFSAFERGYYNFKVLNERRKNFEIHHFRSQREIQQIRDQQSLCKLIVLVGESKRTEDSDITQQGGIVGLRLQQISLPFLGIGPCQMINHSDQQKNILFKVAMKAKEMRQKGLEAFDQNNQEQAKYYLQRMREVQSLHLNPASVKVWADLQIESYKKGKIQNVFKLMNLETKDAHAGAVEHIRFSKNEAYLLLMSKDFMVTVWEVGTWKRKTTFSAYHEAHQKFYLREQNLDDVQSEFDVAVCAINDKATLLVNGLYNGVIQFWDIALQDMALEIPSHLAEVTSLVFNNDNTVLVSSGADYLINVWNATNQQLMFEVREHLGPITHLSFVSEPGENDTVIEQLVSIDIEGYTIFVSLDGYIEKKFSVERSANHSVESMDVLFSGYEVEREMFIVRKNLNSTFYELQKVKAGVEGYYAAYDCNSFPTIMKNKVDKRRPIDFIQVNHKGEFVCMAQKRDNQVTFRNSATLNLERRVEIKRQIHTLACGEHVPYMLVYTDKGVTVWMIEWDIA